MCQPAASRHAMSTTTTMHGMVIGIARTGIARTTSGARDALRKQVFRSGGTVPSTDASIAPVPRADCKGRSRA
jgi:hypothetical protein